MSSNAPAPPPPDQQRSADSPGPPPTTAAAAPDVRARQLQRLVAAALDATLGRVSYGNFAACFPTVAAHKPDTLRRFHADFVKRLGEQCAKHIESILDERGVVPALNALDQLVADAAARLREAQQRADAEGRALEPPVPPHTLPPATLTAAHLAPYTAQQHAKLASRLAQLEARNGALGARVRARRAEADALVAAVERRVGDVRAAAALVARLDDDDNGGDAAAAAGGSGPGALAAETRALAARALPAG